MTTGTHDKGGSRGDDPRTDQHWEAVRAAGRRPVVTPPGLINQVLSSVDRARHGLITGEVTLAYDDGWLRISERALLAICRRRAAELADEVAAHVAGEVGGARIVAVSLGRDGFDVLLSVRFPAPAAAIAEAIGAALRRELHDIVGAGAPVINVHVADVYH